MKTQISYPHGLSASYVRKTLDALLGEPAPGKLHDSSKTLVPDQVPQRYQGIVEAVAERTGKAVITGKDLDVELWNAQHAIEAQDRTFGIHLDGSQPLRILFGIGGNGRTEPKEGRRAARKNAVAGALLALIAQDYPAGVRGAALGSVG